MIAEKVKELLQELPGGVQLVAAVKGRTPGEVVEAVRAGAMIIGESQVQQAERDFAAIGGRVRWHLIGHLQTNKVKRAVKIFDMVETVDSIELAREIDFWCRQIGKVMPVLVEVNVARERQKAGVFPEDVAVVITELARLPNIRVAGLMTLGPRPDSPETLRPYFREVRGLFDRLRTLDIPGVEMQYLSMGMSDSYRVAIDERTNLVRIGSKIFG